MNDSVSDTMNLLKELEEEIKSDVTTQDGDLRSTLIEIISIERRSVYGSDAGGVSQRREKVREIVDLAFNHRKQGEK